MVGAVLVLVSVDMSNILQAAELVRLSKHRMR